MGSIVMELQQEALNPDHKVSDLLRKSLLVSRKLGVADFQKWVSQELNGYGKTEDIPQYRHVVGQVKAHNPYVGWIPIMIEDVEIASIVKKQRVIQSIGDLESLVGDSDGGTLQMRFNTALESQLMKGMDVPFQPVLHIGKNQLVAIIDTVRSAIVEWTLRLEEEGLLGEDYTFSATDKIKAQYSGGINIQNFQGVFGDITHSELNQNLALNIREGDEPALAQYLKSIGVNDKDIQDILELVKKEARPSTRNNLGPQIGTWVGGMVGKAASGAWKIAVGTAGDLLTKAIAAYYGIAE